jgi:hypothetical protein
MKRATKILTVVTLASATPAIAGPHHEHAAKAPERWVAGGDAKVTAVVLEGVPYIVKAGAAPVKMSWGEYGRFLGETAPLVGSDGRPGCGNVLAKSPSTCARERSKAFDARVAMAKKSDKS